jgi:hypothetical protein
MQFRRQLVSYRTGQAVTYRLVDLIAMDTQVAFTCSSIDWSVGIVAWNIESAAACMPVAFDWHAGRSCRVHISF